MRLDVIAVLLAVLRRDQMNVRSDGEVHHEGRQRLATEQVDAVAIALMTAQRHGLIC
ncbi:hypothetical protein D3C78_1687920 [compost metagenome]